jgi:hypothetical protein
VARKTREILAQLFNKLNSECNENPTKEIRNKKKKTSPSHACDESKKLCVPNIQTGQETPLIIPPQQPQQIIQNDGLSIAKNVNLTSIKTSEEIVDDIQSFSEEEDHPKQNNSHAGTMNFFFLNSISDNDLFVIKVHFTWPTITLNDNIIHNLDSDLLDQILTQHNHQNFILQQNIHSVDSLNDEIMDPDQWEEQKPHYSISEFRKRLFLPQNNHNIESDLKNRNQAEVTTNNNVADGHNNDTVSDTQNTLTATVPHDDEMTLTDDHTTFPSDIKSEAFNEKRTEVPHKLNPLSLITTETKTNIIQNSQDDEVKGDLNSKNTFKEKNSTPKILPNFEDKKTHTSRTQTPKSETKDENESPYLSTQEVINKMKEELRYIQASQDLGVDGNFRLFSFVNPQQIDTHKNSTPSWMNIETFLELSVCCKICSKAFV